ncbi:hypothetical protein HYX58_04825 [Candidatus Dependentiae bacterium]|nr:hypothetical protein [Candidatus Dependentiae bacterium]
MIKLHSFCLTLTLFFSFNIAFSEKARFGKFISHPATYTGSIAVASEFGALWSLTNIRESRFFKTRNLARVNAGSHGNPVDAQLATKKIGFNTIVGIGF